MIPAAVPASNGFVVAVSDNSYIHLGIFEGDKLICDYLTSPARFVIGVWDDLTHICTDIGGHLFDEAARTNAPSDAMILGRVVEIARPLSVRQEANPYG